MSKYENLMQTTLSDLMRRVSDLESERDKYYAKLSDTAMQINRLEAERLELLRAIDDKDKRIAVLEKAAADQAKINEAILGLREQISALAAVSNNQKTNNEDVEKSMQAMIQSMFAASGLGE